MQKLLFLAVGFYALVTASTAAAWKMSKECEEICKKDKACANNLKCSGPLCSVAEKAVEEFCKAKNHNQADSKAAPAHNAAPAPAAPAAKPATAKPATTTQPATASSKPTPAQTTPSQPASAPPPAANPNSNPNSNSAPTQSGGLTIDMTSYQNSISKACNCPVGVTADSTNFTQAGAATTLPSCVMVFQQVALGLCNSGKSAIFCSKVKSMTIKFGPPSVKYDEGSKVFACITNNESPGPYDFNSIIGSWK